MKPDSTGQAFSEVVKLIASARQKVLQSINSGLIDLYWRIGEIISGKIEAAEWGDGVVDELARHVARTEPWLRGFTRANLFRIRQFYEVYREAERVAPLARQLLWSYNLVILGQSKRPQEREFYLRMAIREQWSRRELQRQFKAALFERVVLSPARISPVVRQIDSGPLSVFRDAYMLEFLNLPAEDAVGELHRALLLKLKDFLAEFGRDFCFVGSEFPVQVGDRNFALDLLFSDRGLNCLVAFETEGWAFRTGIPWKAKLLPGSFGS